MTEQRVGPAEGTGDSGVADEREVALDSYTVPCGREWFCFNSAHDSADMKSAQVR